MKVYAIFANDNANGTSKRLFSKAVETLTICGHDVDVLDLYQREKEIHFFKHDRKIMESYPFYMENQKRFLEADALLIVFPLFWYSVPGILKTWIDMINGWAYKYEGGMYASPIHKIKKVIILYSAMQDGKHMTEVLHSPVEQQLSETLRFIGITDISAYMIDNVSQMTQDKLKSHIFEVENICKKLS